MTLHAFVFGVAAVQGPSTGCHLTAHQMSLLLLLLLALSPQAAAALNPHTDRATFIYTIPDSFQEVLKIIKSVLFSWNKICQTFSLL